MQNGMVPHSRAAAVLAPWRTSPLPWACLCLLLLPLSPTAFALLAALVLLLWRRARVALAAAPSLWPALVLFVAALAVGVLFSFEPKRSLQTIFKFLPGVLLVYALLREARRAGGIDGDALAPVFALCLAMVALTFVASQFYYGGYLVHAGGLVSVITRNSQTMMLLVMLVAALALWLHDRRPAGFVAALFVLWALFASSGRGGLLAGLAIFAFAIFRALDFRARTIIVASFALATAGAATVFLCYDQLAAARGGNLLTGRDYLWYAAVQVIQDYPWTGIGINTWKYSPYVDRLAFPWVHEAGPHNIILDVLSATGVVGTALLVAGLALLVRTLLRTPAAVSPLMREVGLLLVLAMVLNGMVDFRVFSVQFVGLLGAGLVLWLAGRAVPGAVPGVVPGVVPPAAPAPGVAK